MWYLGLKCDGCPETLGDDDVEHGSKTGLRWLMRNLKGYARDKGWEQVKAPDEEKWFCPTCRRARNGDGLVATGKGARHVQELA